MSTFREEIIGDCRLVLGDCREVLPTLGPVDAVVTSPPYGEIRDYGGHELPDMLEVIGCIAAILAPGGVCMWNTADQTVNGSESGDSFRQALHAMSCGLRLHDTMIYVKEGVSFPDANRYHPAFEYMFVFSQGAPAHFNGIEDWVNKWRGSPIHGTRRETDGSLKQAHGTGRPVPSLGLRRNWWPITNVTRGDGYDHPAKMPFSMAYDHVVTWTAPSATVLDPFTGSGTTAAACIQSGRRFVGCEIEPRYFDIACRRIEEAYKQPRLFAEPPPKIVQPSMFDGGEAA